MIVTPGDILAACQSLSMRIDTATAAIEAAPSVFDDAFVAAWDARARRWHNVRAQCADWASRWWNYKWGPVLEDWRANQAEWEALIEERTGQRLPVPQHDASRDERPIENWARHQAEASVLVIVGALGIAALIAATRKR